MTVLNYQRQNREKMKLKTEINVRALLPCMEFRAAATQRRKKKTKRCKQRVRRKQKAIDMSRLEYATLIEQ